MGRPKLEITKNKCFLVRIEPVLKNEYVKFCKKNKFTISDRIRQFILNELR